jgi:hypothetical protein
MPGEEAMGGVQHYRYALVCRKSGQFEIVRAPWDGSAAGFKKANHITGSRYGWMDVWEEV